MTTTTTGDRLLFKGADWDFDTLARIYDGVHYRTSTEVGTAMGQKIGAWAAAKALRPLP